MISGQVDGGLGVFAQERIERGRLRPGRCKRVITLTRACRRRFPSCSSTTPWSCPAWSCPSSSPTRRRPRSTPPAPRAGRPLDRPPRPRPDPRPLRLLARPPHRRPLRRVGTVAEVEQVGRLPSGEPAAVVRGLRRARIGAGVTGPGAALWVEADRARRARRRPAAPASWPREYKALVVAILQQRGAWQVDRRRAADDRPVRARRHRPATRPYLDARRRRSSCSRPSTSTARLELAARAGPRSTSPSWRSPRRSATTSARAWRRASASSCCASSSPRSARSSARTATPTTASTTTAPASRPPTLPDDVREAALDARSTSSSARQRAEPGGTAGSAPGSTPSSSCRGTSAPTDATDIAARPRASSTPTTPASTT